MMINTTHIRSLIMTCLVAHYNGAKDLSDLINQDFPSPGQKITIDLFTTNALAFKGIYISCYIY